jgi:DNA repair protein RadC
MRLAVPMRKEKGGGRMFKIKEAIVKYKTTMAPVGKIKAPADVHAFFKTMVIGETKENLFALFLGTGNEILCFERLSVGCGDSTIMDAKCMIRTAILVGAKAILLVHNHLSGGLNPSPEDELSTKRMRERLRMVDLELLDHVIVTEDGFTSLKERGVL